MYKEVLETHKSTCPKMSAYTPAGEWQIKIQNLVNTVSQENLKTYKGVLFNLMTR